MDDYATFTSVFNDFIRDHKTSFCFCRVAVAASFQDLASPWYDIAVKSVDVILV